MRHNTLFDTNQKSTMYIEEGGKSEQPKVDRQHIDSPAKIHMLSVPATQARALSVTAHQMRSDAKGSITACREELPAYALPEAPRLKFQKRLLLCEFDIILPWQKNGKAFARASVPA